MTADWTPMRWPSQWRRRSDLEYLRDTPIDFLVIEPGPIADEAVRAGLKTIRPAATPEGVTILQGAWPGIRLSRFGARDTVSSGPTGEPWVDSNVWPIRLAQARNPNASVWLRATPRDNNREAAPSVTAMADAAIAGGRWIVTLTESVAAGVADGNPEAMKTWKTIAGAAGFFASRRAWTGYQPEAVPGILSDFTTPRTREMLNLIGRTGQQYRIVLKEGFTRDKIAGLKALIDPDGAAPAPAIRAEALRFVNAGGLLIAGPEWGAIAGTVPNTSSPHPRFAISALGKGTVAISKAPPGDPYLFASDAGILISHRHDLLRFWNGGPLSASYASAPDGRQGVVQIVFYSNRPAGGDMSVRIAGNYRAAKIATLRDPVARPIKAIQQQDALEVNLPGSADYIALELEA